MMDVFSNGQFNDGIWGEEKSGDILFVHFGRLVYALNMGSTKATIVLPFDVYDNVDCTDNSLVLGAGAYTILARRK